MNLHHNEEYSFVFPKLWKLDLTDTTMTDFGLPDFNHGFNAIVYVKNKNLLVGTIDGKLYQAETQPENIKLKWKYMGSAKHNYSAGFNLDNKSYFIAGNQIYEVVDATNIKVDRYLLVYKSN